MTFTRKATNQHKPNYEAMLMWEWNWYSWTDNIVNIGR